MTDGSDESAVECPNTCAALDAAAAAVEALHSAGVRRKATYAAKVQADDASRDV